jgi:nitrite reductase/ring-hydroxylating ferredoxin subunit
LNSPIIQKKKIEMERRDFLEKLGIGAAFVLTTACLGSCKQDSVTPSNADFVLDLNAAENAALKTNGGYVVSNGIVVARTTTGGYAAATVTCSHEQKKQVTYNKSTNEWLCTAHQARFDMAGKGLNNEGNAGLAIYKTSLTGTSLRVYS